MGGVVPRYPPSRGLRLHRGRHGVLRRTGATAADHRLQTGRRPRPRLLPHRSAVSARRTSGQDGQPVPRLLQAAGGHRGRVRRGRFLPDRRYRRRTRAGPDPLCGPAQQRAQAGPGRVRHPGQTRSRVQQQQPAGAADLRVRQQRSAVSAGRGGTHRGRPGALVARRAQAEHRRVVPGCRQGAGAAELRGAPGFPGGDHAVHGGERSADRDPEAGLAQAQGPLRTRTRGAVRRARRRAGSRVERAPIRRCRRAGDRDRGARCRGTARCGDFTDLGGDSLSALTFGNLLQEIFGVEVPVSVIVSPASDLATIAAHIETQRAGGTGRPTFSSVHGRHAAEVTASELTLDKFLDSATLAAAPSLPKAGSEIRTVLLTGATGFLGRYLALEWLERMDLVDGKLICLVRARSDEEARARLDKTFDSAGPNSGGDPKLLAHYRELAADHLEVIAGDKGEADLGLDKATWQRLADTVDFIVDPAALVNHVLPYSELFGPNALGTAELIRIALTTKIKPFAYVSTIGVGDQIEPGTFVEDADVRTMSATRAINDSYANGYGTSKWAGEVLLREAHDLAGLPVSVFRCDMILADTTYAGQLNLPDMFTRMMFSLVATGIAPGSFYQLDAEGKRQASHYDGLPVEFIAEAISTLGAHVQDGFATYHVMNPYDDGIGMDTFVDWLVEAGYKIERVDDYAEWLSRFETTLRGLPDRQRQASLLPLLHNYQHPETPLNGSIAPTEVFRAAVQDAKIGADKDIPHVSAPVIVKYITDLQLLGLI
ncbi:thioester reductase domain-containing protein [Mycobacterium hackensackense]|nr:thioester reductase domain-containing protein [Mycobacterium hackensackense]